MIHDPRVAQRLDTAEAATHPATCPPVIASNPVGGQPGRVKVAQPGAEASNVAALPFSMPAW